MRGQRGWFAAITVALAAVLAVSLSVAPNTGHAALPPATQAAVDNATVVCPDASGSPHDVTTTIRVAQVDPGTAASAGPTTVSYRPLTGTAVPPVELTPRPDAGVVRTAPDHALAVTAQGPAAGGVVADQVSLDEAGSGRGLRDVACQRPGADWWFAGADGRVGYLDDLRLANPSDTPATVTVRLWGAKGPLAPPRLDALSVPALSSVRLRVSDYAPDVAVVAAHVHADSGAVTAAMLDDREPALRPHGSDWIAPTAPPARSLVVNGFRDGSGSRVLVLAAPGPRDATVSLRVLTPTRNFVPSGSPSVVVRAGHTLAVDLASALGGEWAAVALTSDQPVLAEGFTEGPATGANLAELQWQPASRAMTSAGVLPADAPPLSGWATLLLAAPDGAARVRVAPPGADGVVLSVAAGRVAVVDLATALRGVPHPTGPLVVSPLDGAPVHVLRLLAAVGAHGVLLAVEPPSGLQPPVLLPPAVADLRAALP